MKRGASFLFAVAVAAGLGATLLSSRQTAGANAFVGPFAGTQTNAIEIVSIVQDAGTLTRADRDVYGNTFVAGAMAVDGGAGAYGYKCEQSPCTTDFGAGTQDEVTASGNTLTWNVSDQIFSTFHVTQPANKTNTNVRWYADTGYFFGFFPTTDTTGCVAGSAGGVRYVSTDTTLRFCDGTTLRTLATIIEATASVDFPTTAANGTATATFTLSGALTTDVPSCSWQGTPESGLMLADKQVTAADTITLTVHTPSGGGLDPAAIDIKCQIVRK